MHATMAATVDDDVVLSSVHIGCAATASIGDVSIEVPEVILAYYYA